MRRADLTQEQKQNVAKEFNLSEIVFLHLPVPGASFKNVEIDIFTSQAEVPFAVGCGDDNDLGQLLIFQGHPTVGSSHYLLNALKEDTEVINTKAGPIPISRDPKTGGVRALIPQTFHIHKATFDSPLTPKAAEVTSIVKGMSFIFCPLPDLEILAKAAENLNVRKYGVTATYDPRDLDEGWQVGLVGTMYYVAQGIDEFGRKMYRTRMWGSREDPGTGSASSALGCYLAGQEPADLGAGPFQYALTQGVEMGRTNDISVEVTRGKDGLGIEEVLLSGAAVSVMEGVVEI